MPRRHRLAAAALVAALAASPLSAQARPDALRMFREGKYEDARVTCLAELAADPSNIESYVVLVWSLLGLERYADAELYAAKAYSSVRKDPRIAEALGEAAFFQGKNDEALRYFQAYINLLPDGSRIGSVYYYMGEVYLRQVNLGHADIAMRTALQYEPGNALWWTRLGYVRERLSEWSYALDAYDAALAINPGLVDAQRGRERAQARLAP